MLVAGGDESREARSILYCVVPRELSGKLFEALREHFRGDPDVRVVVERRGAERRGGHATRRAADAAPRDAAPRDAAARDAAPERRRIRGRAGRRLGERRALTVASTTLPALPRKARHHAAQLVFVERLEPSASYTSDAESKRLVLRYQAGDEAVFGELYLRYFNHVYAYARVALGDHHEAEDATQHVFIRAMSALPRYEPRRNVAFRGWLFSIARNVVIDAVKERHGLHPEAPESIDLLRDQERAPEEDVAETLGWLSDREVAMFVERLPLPQRQVLVLRFMLDLSGEEIAQALGRSPNSVRKLQQRALDSLQRRLAAVGRTPPRRGGVPMLVRIRPLPVMGQRRFALGKPGAPRRFAA